MTRPTERPFADLTGRRAVVTGASSGIGRAIAMEFAQAGADLIVHCRQSRDRASAVVDSIHALGRKGVVIPSDFRDASHIRQFVHDAWESFNGVDIWVNNAGADLLTGSGTSLNYDQKLKRLWDVDVRGTIQLSKMAGGRMSDAGGGVILNIGWDQADRGMEGDSGELFATAKNAIMGFTRSLALTLAPAVRVNCIAPGWIRTAWGAQASDVWQERVHRETPLQRWGTPEDIAALARFLVSSEAGYITGQVINANGGAMR